LTAEEFYLLGYITPYNLMKDNHLFDGTYCFYLQCRNIVHAKAHHEATVNPAMVAIFLQNVGLH
jgi:hypothetical protein